MFDPVAFALFGRPIYWYGIFVALGFLAAVVHWNLLARRKGMPDGIGSDLGFIVMIGGIVGARIAYVLANFTYYRAHPLEIIRVDQGGLVFYGGFLLAAGVVIAMARLRRLALWPLADFAVSALPLGHAFGRTGCFLNGCCYGAPTELPWAVYQADALRHPVQLYETFVNLALYTALHLMLRRPLQPGRVLQVYLLGYGAWRFAVEFLRGDARLAAAGGLDAAQLVSLVLIASGLALQLVLRRPNAPPAAA
jgi:phosphatidylglycerol:prolipoprotein diacylglycerol transferase